MIKYQGERWLLIQICWVWLEKKNFHTFKLLYLYGFQSEAKPLFRIWRILRNTLNGRYREIAIKGYEAWR